MPCLSGRGYKKGETARAEAQEEAATHKAFLYGVIAADNAFRLYDNYRNQKKIAARGVEIQERYQEFLVAEFWPKEESYLEEFANPDTHGEKPEDVEVVGSRYAGRMVPMIAKKFAEEITMAKCNSSRYCTSANKRSLQDILLGRSNALASARVAGRQLAYKEWRAHIDKNYKRRFDAVAVGDGMIAQAANLFGMALAAYQTAGDDISKQFNSALKNLGSNISTRGSAGTRLNQLAAQNEDFNNVVVNGFTEFGVTNTFGQMTGDTGSGSNTFGGYNIGMSSQGVNAFATLSTNYSSNGEAVLNGSQLINQLDLARSGSYTYEVASIIPGTVTVNMNDFPLQDYAEKDSGDRTS